MALTRVLPDLAYNFSTSLAPFINYGTSSFGVVLRTFDDVIRRSTNHRRCEVVR